MVYSTAMHSRVSIGINEVTQLLPRSILVGRQVVMIPYHVYPVFTHAQGTSAHSCIDVFIDILGSVTGGGDREGRLVGGGLVVGCQEAMQQAWET